LVAYPIFDLRGFPSESLNRNTMGVIEFVRNLEEILIRTCAEFGIPTKRIAGLTGVWTSESRERQGNAREAKIAALGVHISRGTTSHGVALNVNTDLSYFNLIVPCGIHSKPVTSIEMELARKVPFQDVAHILARNFGQVFNSQILWLESIEALLGKNFGIPMRPPGNLRKIHSEDDPAWA
jgi:lipoyl(octanoyl) transferase